MEDYGATNALAARGPTPSSPSPFAVQSNPNRSRPAVGTSSTIAPAELDRDGSCSVTPRPSSTGQPGPTQSPTEHPLSSAAFLLGLKHAGYLEPLDTSRNKIKQRFNHFLEKQNFKANLYAFLEHAGVERLGESMVRFVGVEEPHSPYVSVFVTSAIATQEAVKIYAADSSSSSSVARSSTRWTFLSAESNANCEWACKAKRFWSVRVRFEGPNSRSTPAVPSPAATPPTRPRGKRRDTFQREVDLDAEWDRREQEEADKEERVKLNTTKNSARPSNSPAIAIDTKNTAPVEPPLEDKEQRTPVTPTVLEAAKQLGTSIVASLPPSMQQLPTTMQHRIKQWFEHPTRGPGDQDEYEDEEYDSEEDRRRREKRRKRRERRRLAEEQERELSDSYGDEADEERRARRAEKRRRRALERERA